MAEHFVGGGIGGANAGSGLRRRQLPCARGSLYTHIYAQSIANGYADTNTNGHSGPNADTNTYGYSSPNTDACPNGHSGSNTGTNSHGYSGPDTDTLPHCHSSANANAYPHGYSDAHADRHTGPNAGPAQPDYEVGGRRPAGTQPTGAGSTTPAIALDCQRR